MPRSTRSLHQAETTEDQVAGGVLTPSAVLPVGKWAEGAAVVGDTAVGLRKRRTHHRRGRSPPRHGRPADRQGRPAAGRSRSRTGWQGGVLAAGRPTRPCGCSPSTAARVRSLQNSTSVRRTSPSAQAAAWVLTWPDCSSNNSRLDPRPQDRPPRTRPGCSASWGEAVALGHGSAWVAHASGGFVSRVDLKSLAVDRVELGDFSGWEIVDAGRVVLAGGRAGDDNTRGLVVAIDPASGLEVARIEVAEMVQRIAVDGDRAYAIGLDGRMFVLAIDGLKLIGDYTERVRQVPTERRADGDDRRRPHADRHRPAAQWRERRSHPVLATAWSVRRNKPWHQRRPRQASTCWGGTGVTAWRDVAPQSSQL